MMLYFEQSALAMLPGVLPISATEFSKSKLGLLSQQMLLIPFRRRWNHISALLTDKVKPNIERGMLQGFDFVLL